MSPTPAPLLAMKISICIALDEPVGEPDRQQLRQLLPGLTASMLVLSGAEHEQVDKLLSLLVGSVRLTAADVLAALLEADTLRAVCRGTEWLTSEQLSEFASLATPDCSVATVRRWQRRRLFSLRHQGADYFPKYALAPDFRPLPAVGRVMKVLQDFSAEQLALWFENASEPLQGMRPRELISRAPARVVAAAHVAAAGGPPGHPRGRG
jgi:hypothetical protein